MERTCPKCGCKIENKNTMFCPRCDEILNSDAKKRNSRYSRFDNDNSISYKKPILVVAILIAAIFMVKGISCITQKPTDVSKGVKILKEMEERDIGDVEQQVQSAQAQISSAANEGDDTGESANVQGNEEAVINRNYKEIFANSVVMGDSIAEGLFG